MSDVLAHEDSLRGGLREGLCHVVSLNCIKEALGPRWSRNQALLKDYVLRSFHTGAQTDDLIIQVNEVDFVLIQPSRSRLSALSRAARLTRMTLNHFLGEAKDEQIRVSIIEQANPGEILARRVPPVELVKAEQEDDTPSPKPIDRRSPPWEAFGTPRSPRYISLYKRPEGNELKAQYFLEPIWNPSHEAVGIFYLRSQTFQIDGFLSQLVNRNDLTARSLGIVATRRLRHAREILEKTPHDRMALSVPLSLDGFAHSSSRIAIISKLRQISERSDTHGRLFVDLRDISCDTSVMRVAEAVAQLKAYVRRVTVRIPSNCADFSVWAQSNADGLTLDLEKRDPAFLSERRLLNLYEQARMSGNFLAVDGIQSLAQAFMCFDCGVREISGLPISQAYGEQIESGRLSQTQVWPMRRSA